MKAPDCEFVLSDPLSADAEAFAALRAKLLLGPWGEAPHRALAVVSADEGDGRTYVSANLAASISQMGRRTLLVDADLRRPRQHELFSTGNERGLSTCLAGRQPVDCTHSVAGFPFLSIVPAGPLPDNPIEHIHSPAFATWMQHAMRDYDLVIVDTPSANANVEALAIAAIARYALVVGRNGLSRVRSVQFLLDALSQAGVQVAGIAMNDH
jgi:capsular exopolysaccharide synthesis family protein